MRIKQARRFMAFTTALAAVVLLAVCEMPSLERFTAPPPSDAAETWIAPAGMDLVWSDEFDGPDIDLSNWSYETEATGWSPTWNHEWQRYTDNGEGGPNACINDGVLVIRALNQGGGDGGYTSARLVTKGRHSFQYGTIVARLQLPYGQGMWPAFWLMGNTGAWPANGEIDVMEMIGGATEIGGTSDYRTHGALHWEDVPDHHQSVGGEYDNPSRLADDWHYYELNWDENTITIRFDNHVVLTQNITGAEYDEFRQPAYILLNLAVGGTWGGYPDGTSVFPQYMYIDWVRVYQPVVP